MQEELQAGFPILTFLTFFPLIGAIAVWAMKDEDLIKKSTLGVAVLELVVAVWLLLGFVPDSAAMQFSERYNWIPALGISYHMAVDGISVLFVGLTAFLTVLLVLYAWDTVKAHPKAFYMSILGLEMTIMGIFASIDLILFFVFWELMLIPSYFLIKLWGIGKECQTAALKYVLYTLLGSVFMLVGFCLLDLNHYAVKQTYSFDLLELLSVPIPMNQQLLIFWFLFLGFAFKAPVFPFHSWLPDALVQGPIPMSVMLAGIKMGTYGFLRFSFPLLPDASRDQTVVAIVMVLGLIAIVYGAIVAIIQLDLRRLLVFSSISHLGFVVIGLFALNFQGIQGSLLTMINLGFSTAGLFFLAGFVYERLGHTNVNKYSGLAKKMPLLATFFLIIGMASIGLPGTNGFVGEFLILLGVFQAYWLYGAIAVTGVIFAAAYFLWFYERGIFGPLKEGLPATLKDLNTREWGIGIALCVMIFWIGLYPSPFLRMMNGSVQEVVDRLNKGSAALVAPEPKILSQVIPD
ncbi:MAG: NADH-quinone oxidoreductase subunit M [Nitrospirales bacterium]|nr:NADH-quinone oxidoreductase subunit M [Nitrospira sp.]MDR4500680.1 NADH-quinone oxidoreductase subunit M [Nitrospirales bacterium]